MWEINKSKLKIFAIKKIYEKIAAYVSKQLSQLQNIHTSMLLCAVYSKD